MRSILLSAALLGALVPSAAEAQPAPAPARAAPAPPAPPRPAQSPVAPPRPFGADPAPAPDSTATAPRQAPTPDIKAAARAAADRGQQLFDAGQYAEAIAAFQEADKLFHAPTFVLMIARTQDRLGHLIEARASYGQIIAERLAHYAPQAFLDAQATAKTELEALLARIPSVQTFVTGAPTNDVQLTIDGAAAQVGKAIQMNPGVHTLAASAPGRVPAKQQINLQEGIHAQFTLDLAPPPPNPKPPTPKPLKPAAAEPPVPEQPTPSRSGYPIPVVASFAVAGAALGVGLFTGGLSSSEVNDLEKKCPDKRCYDNDDADETYGSARTAATVSTIAFVAGGLALATGVVLLVMDTGGDEPVEAGVVAGPGWLGATGRF